MNKKGVVMTIDLDKIKSDYTEKHPKSMELWKRAKKVLAGGCTRPSSGRIWNNLGICPPYMNKALGTNKWDVDGNKYTFYWQHQAMFLGHAHPAIVEAIQTYTSLGPFPFDWNEIQIKWAEKIVKMVPCAEKVIHVMSGTEANMYALQFARAYTKRNKIIRFAGHFHGHSSELAAEWSVDGQKYPPFSNRVQSIPGIPDEMTKNVVVVSDKIEEVEKAIKKHNPAAVIIEGAHGSSGGGMSTGAPNAREFMKVLREITKENGVVLIADEVITGFRLAPGGAQEYYPLECDMAVLGKNVCGSIPGSGAICGKNEIIEDLSPPKGKVATGGTFSGNPLNMAAGYAALSVIDSAGGKLNVHANSLGERYVKELNDIFERYSFPAQAVGTGGLCYPSIVKDKKDLPIETVLDFQMKNDRIAALKLRLWLLTYAEICCPSGFSMSAVHTNEDIDNLIAATETYVKLEKG